MEEAVGKCQPLNKPLLAKTAGERLDRLPVCGFHSRILRLIASGLFLDSVDVYLQGPLLAFFLATGWSTVKQNANFLSTTFAGLLLGTLVAGRLSDLFGRRRMYQANLLVFGSATALAAFAPTPAVLSICRFFAGIGLGGEVVVSYGTLTEFIPPSVRGIWQGKLASLSNFGLPASALLCSLTFPWFGWRPVMVIVGVAAGVVLVFQRRLPESPRWYESVGKLADCERTLCLIESEVERRSGTSVAPLALSVSSKQIGNRPGVRFLFQSVMLRRTLLASWLMIVANVVVYTFTAWLPTLILHRSVTLKQTLAVTWLLQLGALPGSVAGSWVSERLGRRAATALFSVAAALLGLLFPFAKDVLGLISFGFLLFFFVYGLVAITFAVYVPEIFPTALRMTGAGFATACGRAANILVPQTIPWILARFGSFSLCFFIAGLLIVQAVIVWIFGEDTERRSLEAINAIH